MSSVSEMLDKIVEGILFASHKPLRAEDILKFFEEAERPSIGEVRAALQRLQTYYQDRGVILQEVASGFRVQVAKEVAPWISKLWEEKPARLTRALLETLALIAYRQPITRGEIEDIRGVVVSTQIVKNLMELEWIRVVGHKEVPGRPALYATTKYFLDHFNIKNLDELPPLSELRDLDEIAKELDQKFEAENMEAENTNVIEAEEGFEVEVISEEISSEETLSEKEPDIAPLEEVIMTCPMPPEREDDVGSDSE